MSEIRQDLQYTKDHEWVKPTSRTGVVRIGITDFAQSSLGDVTFLQMPSVGASVSAGQAIGTVESVKAVSDIYAPVTGKVVTINESLNSDPSPINSAPYDNGWILEIELTKEAELKTLLQPGAYASIAQ